MPGRPPFSSALGPLFAFIALAVTIGSAGARPLGAILHEPIVPDPREDIALNASLDGDLAVALETANGVVSAPDPRALPVTTESTYGPGDHDTFSPDRDTRRPEMGSYDDPFVPPTAPFKRLHAYDGVRGDFQLYVRREQRIDLSTNGPQGGPDDDAFYADLVVEVGPDRSARIPSVGPGSRIVRARLGVGANELSMRVVSDGAENWFLRTNSSHGRTRARLVMELVVERAALDGTLSDPSWSDLPPIPSLPANVAREAAIVRSAIGVSRRMRPREAIRKLTSYFRAFAESNDPPSGHGSVYLDLTLSKKGVCRHRAFAFLVTAQSLGIPTRVITNEAHAWVEVFDARLWRRIDLGGAAPMANGKSGGVVAGLSTDAIAPPQSAPRDVDLSAAAWAPGASLGRPNDDRPPSALSLAVGDAEAYRGQPLSVRGEVRADGDPCPHVGIELWLRSASTQRRFPLGRLATGDDGSFSDRIVISAEAPLGDYDVVARTTGDDRCGAGVSE